MRRKKQYKLINDIETGSVVLLIGDDEARFVYKLIHGAFSLLKTIFLG